MAPGKANGLIEVYCLTTCLKLFVCQQALGGHMIFLRGFLPKQYAQFGTLQEFGSIMIRYYFTRLFGIGVSGC